MRGAMQKCKPSTSGGDMDECDIAESLLSDCWQRLTGAARLRFQVLDALSNGKDARGYLAWYL